LGGLGPGLLASVLSSFLATALYTDWPSGTHLGAWSAHVALFLSIGIGMSLILHQLQRAYAAQHAALLTAREAEQQARSSAAQLRVIADALPVLIAYIDREQRYRFNNRYYEEWAGVPPVQLLGQPVREVMGEQGYRAVRQYMEEALSGRRVSFQTQLSRRDGSTRHINAHYVPDVAADGTVLGYFKLVEDITERHRTAQALEDAHRSLSLALRAGRAGSLEWDIGANAMRWSEQLLDLFGFGSGQFGGTREDWLACIDPEDRERVLEAIDAAFKSGEIEVEYRIRRRDNGELRWIQGRGQVLYDESGHPQRMLGINVDITERKRAEEALQIADRRKDEFLAMLAHELRNPLAAIRNVAHVLTGDTLDLAAAHRLGELVNRQTSQLARLVDDLLDVARVTRGLIELKKEPLMLQSVVDRAIETLDPLLRLKRQTVGRDLGSETIRVNGDPARLRQVFENLISNAAKYSPDHSTIQISFESAGQFASVRIQDEGDGIDPQTLPHVFDLFMQADRSLDRSQGGLGVGLTIVKHLAELHGGSVEARSQGLGTGSEFIVRLPQLVRTESRVARSLDDEATAGVARRVLIVEDNMDTAESLAMLLRAAGHEVQIAHEGPSALKLLEQFQADVGLLDIGLPGMDGYLVAQAIRERSSQGTMRLYALSGYGRQEDRSLALTSGFNDHLTKPIEPQRLLQLIAQEDLARPTPGISLQE